MGKLRINQVTYSGDKYYYISPKINEGLNLFVGDNGSGKTTLTLFIDFALGGNVDVFRDNKTKRKQSSIKYEYREVLDDANNFVELDLDINSKNFKLKRFIRDNEIFIDDGEFVFSRKIFRKGKDETFSDWLLKSIDIEPFELNMGTYSWTFDFHSLYRLINYDQYTPNNKIYKLPTSDNFVSDSQVIRKSIFETLLNTTSDEYHAAFNLFKAEEKKFKELTSNFNSLIKVHEDFYDESICVQSLLSEIENKETKLEALKSKRISLSTASENKGVSEDAVKEAERVLLRVIDEKNEKRKEFKELKYELARVNNFASDLESEIEQIQKIIFTHEALDLFHPDNCPLCKKEFKQCEQHLENLSNSSFNYTYSIEEYRNIYKQKVKKKNTIESAKESISQDVKAIRLSLRKLNSTKLKYKKRLNDLVKTLKCNSELTELERINYKINDLNDELYLLNKRYSVNKEILALKSKKEASDGEKKRLKTSLYNAEKNFIEGNEEIIKRFNKEFSNLMDASPLKISCAKIDQDYMPEIDGGVYREISSGVIIRLAYYFSLLIYSLKFEKSSFPNILIIDTPEDSGIDTPKLISTLESFYSAVLEASNKNFHDYQIILTTGEDRYPKTFDNYIVDEFKEKEGNFILKVK